MSKIYLGIDVGSVSINLSILDEKRNIIEDRYIRHKGQPIRTVAELLGNNIIPMSEPIVGITGSGGRMISQLIEVLFVNEIIAQAKSIERMHPDVRTIIDMGGEDSKLIILNYDSNTGRISVEDFAMNTICAAGTGSFLDQQASRLGVSIEDKFGKLALKSKKPPRIAGRCSVFAKTDMIHLQQKAAPVHDIVAGLCFALARNFRANIGKGKNFVKPVSFQGGVAANIGMVTAFEDVLELAPGELIVPKHHASMGAIGAALVAMEKSAATINITECIKRLNDYLNSPKEKFEGLEPLADTKRTGSGGSSCFADTSERKASSSSLQLGTVEVYLGVDVGSISTNVVVIDRNKNVLAKSYLMTAGRPIEAVRHGIEEVANKLQVPVEIKGSCTTGSGRYLTGDFIGADVIKNEITAQARAAIEIDPNVDTIFEIGGQDSKYISIENGAIIDFQMNNVCAAGTGSFLEEQAEKLGIKIKEEFGDLALKAKVPVRMGERCTVFMESDLVHHQVEGAQKDDLVAGLSYAIAYNYLNKVVGNKKVGNRIFFQGGVAANTGVVRAFEKITHKSITVPKDHEVTGAIGCALLAMDEAIAGKIKQSKFKGFDLSKKDYSLDSFECKDCPNICRINRVSVENEEPLHYGSRCGKHDIKRGTKDKQKIPDLFAEREKLLLGSYTSKATDAKGSRPRIGIPKALMFHELFPLWNTFFTELEFQVVLSDKTNNKITHQGVENVSAEICFPIKAAHGHVLNLIEKGIDYLFLPSILELKQSNPNLRRSFVCPYVQTVPYVIDAALDLKSKGIKLIRPVIHLRSSRRKVEEELIDLGKELGIDASKIKAAFRLAEKAQEDFYAALRFRGKEVLSSLKSDDIAMVIISRPYNGCDPGMNLQLPKKLKDLGVLSIPLDYLPIDDIDISTFWPNMTWRYGQKILSAAEIVRKDKRLYAIYITNFACGPDSFITKFFKRQMADKPYLEIQVDEHSQDVGAITRCEAFLDSLKSVSKEESCGPPKRVEIFSISRESDRTLYMPKMSDHAFVLEAAFTACGIKAEVLPQSDERSIYWGRKFTSGRECFPCILTTGDMAKLIKDNPSFDHKRCAFFMPSGSGSCRFDHYNTLHRIVLDELGYKDVPIYSPNQDIGFYKDLGIGGAKLLRLAWRGIVVVDIIDKLRRQIRPYEINKGRTDKVYEQSLQRITQTIRRSSPLTKLIKDIRGDFENIEQDRNKKRPIIGIVGEVFVRMNEFSNDNIVRQIENLGGEVYLPAGSEWIMYTNYLRKSHAKKSKDLAQYIRNFLTTIIQLRDERRFLSSFKGCLNNHHEPPIEQILEHSRTYIDPSHESEAILSVGKSIDYILQGLSGIVNVMPFTCMPGTITSAIFKKVKQDHSHIPFLTIAYDGLGQTNTKTRLEAFMYQAQQLVDSR